MGVRDSTDGVVSNLLHDGESRVDSITVADAQVVLTNRRLLVIREEGSPRLRAVDRLNVGSVRRRRTGGSGSLRAATVWVAVGLFLSFAWQYVPFDVFDRTVSPPASGMGVGDLFAAVNALLGLLRVVDEAFLAAAVLAVAWAAVHLVRWFVGRRRVLEVTVTGEEPVRFSVADDEAVDRLRALVSVATGGRND